MSKKSVLITGTSTGIGHDAALEMAKDGWIVFAGVRKQTDFDSLGSSHENIRPVFLDLTKPEQIASAIDSIRVAVGDTGLDALVNNASVSHPAPIELQPPEDFEAELQLNLSGVFRLTQAALPLLRLGEPGRIVNIGSIVGRLSLPYLASYCVSKYGLESLTMCMRQELKPMGIGVACLGAGPVKTNFRATATKNYEAVRDANIDNPIYEQFYAKRMKDAMDGSIKMEKALSTESITVARKVKYMLKTSWLRHRYCDSIATWIMTQMATFLPTWILERLAG